MNFDLSADFVSFLKITAEQFKVYNPKFEVDSDCYYLNVLFLNYTLEFNSKFRVEFNFHFFKFSESCHF